MAYRRRTMTVRQGRYAKSVSARRRSPKHNRRATAPWLLGSIFNTQWLWGRNRTRKKR